MSKEQEKLKIKWHPAFYSAAEFDFRNEKEMLEFHAEYQLSKEPLAMDLLIIEKRANVVLENALGQIFRRYNIIEYKSPDDSLNIDDFYKTIAYAALFKGTALVNDMYPADELTVSLFREAAPLKLMQQLQASGLRLEEKFPGVFYVYGNTLFPVQIVVTKKLSSKMHAALKLLSKNVLPEDVRIFLDEAGKAKNENYNVDSILQVSVSANEMVYEALRRDNFMCEALRKLMKNDLEIERAEGKLEGKIEGKLSLLYELVKDNILSVKQAAQRANLSEAEFLKRLEAAKLN